MASVLLESPFFPLIVILLSFVRLTTMLTRLSLVESVVGRLTTTKKRAAMLAQAAAAAAAAGMNQEHRVVQAAAPTGALPDSLA